MSKDPLSALSPRAELFSHDFSAPLSPLMLPKPNRAQSGPLRPALAGLTRRSDEGMFGTSPGMYHSTSPRVGSFGSPSLLPSSVGWNSAQRDLLGRSYEKGYENDLFESGSSLFKNRSTYGSLNESVGNSRGFLFSPTESQSNFSHARTASLQPHSFNSRRSLFSLDEDQPSPLLQPAHASNEVPSFLRRSSVAATGSSYSRYSEYLAAQMEELTLDNYDSLFQRRHSVAASGFAPRKPTDSPFLNPADSKYLDEGSDGHYEQFQLDLGALPEDDHATSKYTKPSKNDPPICYYVCEFKSGRTDVFYITKLYPGPVAMGDLVIVEADRGEDLGKVSRINVPIEEFQISQNPPPSNSDGVRTNKPIEPKLMIRPALPHEVHMLVSKYQEEAKALALCQARIQQRNLTMEVVDAEYQWDRRKLTFYFIADKRIDFRDLVKELFKIYKTRIWMCSVGQQ
jgi:hypothetical protein